MFENILEKVSELTRTSLRFVQRLIKVRGKQRKSLFYSVSINCDLMIKLYSVKIVKKCCTAIFIAGRLANEHSSAHGISVHIKYTRP